MQCFGFIYKLYHPSAKEDNSLWYVGGTQYLSARLSKHLSQIKNNNTSILYQKMRDVSPVGWKMDILETVPLSTDDSIAIRRHTLGTVERKYQTELRPGLNSIVPFGEDSPIWMSVCDHRRYKYRCEVCNPDKCERNRLIAKQRIRLLSLSKQTGIPFQTLRERFGIANCTKAKCKTKSCEHQDNGVCAVCVECKREKTRLYYKKYYSEHKQKKLEEKSSQILTNPDQS